MLRRTVLLSAETAYALVGVLAASPLTVGSKQKSAALRADFSFVAVATLSTRLPLPAVAVGKRVAGPLKDATASTGPQLAGGGMGLGGLRRAA